MRARALYDLVDMAGQPLMLTDVGHDQGRPSLTNDAEAVIADLADQGRLPPGRRVFYRDSSGDWDELVVRAGRFAGFCLIGDADRRAAGHPAPSRDARALT